MSETRNLSDKDKDTPLVYYDESGTFSYVADPSLIYHLVGGHGIT